MCVCKHIALEQLSSAIVEMLNDFHDCAEAWKMLNDHERRTIYKERNKTKLQFVKKFNWIRDKQRCRIVGLRQDLAKNAKQKKPRKNAKDTQRFRKKIGRASCRERV